jgi:calcineurin-like phosphoesterase family protein
MKSIKRSWITSDTHFLHKKVCDFCNRPYNFGALITKYWQHLIKPEDIVYHLGDVIFGNKKELEYFIKDLPGTKVLVRGNHDKSHSDNFFIGAGFDIVCKEIHVKNFILSHKPVLIDEGKINIHGHFHNMSKSHWEPNLVSVLTDRHYLYSLENAKYKPGILKDHLNKDIFVRSKNVLW